jgi:Protein of unknown function, DUF488
VTRCQPQAPSSSPAAAWPGPKPRKRSGEQGFGGRIVLAAQEAIRPTNGRRCPRTKSAVLRTWYHHDPAKFAEFRRRYTAELAEPGPREALARLRAPAAARPVTLLTATKDLDLSQAAVLAGLLRQTT